MNERIWLPDSARPQPSREAQLVGEAPPDEDTFAAVLCGGPYGEKKADGKPVRIRKGTVERTVMIAGPESRLIHTKRGSVQRYTFVPSSEEGVWRPKSAEEVPN